MIPAEATLALGATIVLKTRPAVDLTDDEFFALCQANRDLRFERSAEGDLVIMSPTGGETGRRGAQITAQLVGWANESGQGVAFDSSTGFRLPDGSVRSPDAAWLRGERYADLSEDQRSRFIPLCPDFVIELRSPSDALRAKMQAYIDNGARLAWLIDPEDRQVHVYRAGSAIETHVDPAEIVGDPDLPGFTLRMGSIWA